MVTPKLSLPGITQKRRTKGLNPTKCARCGQPILAGYHDTKVGSWHTKADPTALTLQTETAALILGRNTINITGQPGTYLSWHRNFPQPHPHRTLTPLPNDGVVWNILIAAEHKCGHPPLPGTPIPLHPPPQEEDDPNQPPPF